MAGEMDVRFTGAVVSDPEVRTAGDKRVVSIRLAQSARYKKGDEYVDSETYWIDGSLWERWPGDRRVDNVLASLTKGARVDVVGKMRAEAYTTRDDRSGVTNRLQIELIAPSLEYAVAVPVKNERRESGAVQGGQAGWNAPQAQQGWAAAPAAAQGAGQPAWGQPAGAPVQPAPAAPQQLGSGFDDFEGEPQF